MENKEENISQENIEKKEVEKNEDTSNEEAETQENVKVVYVDSREEVSLAAGEALAKIGDPLAIEALSNHCRELEESSERSYENYRAA